MTWKNCLLLVSFVKQALMDGCEMSTAMMIKAAFLVQLRAHYCAFIISARNNFSISFTMFQNHRKSLIQHCDRSELRLHLEWTKVHQKCQKWFGEFLKNSNATFFGTF